MIKLNFDSKIVSLEKLLHSWSLRKLSLKGKIIIIKTLALSLIQHLWSHPSMSKQLTNFVSDSTSISLHSLMGNIGHGSNRQDFIRESLIILATASSETCVKAVIILQVFY